MPNGAVQNKVSPSSDLEKASQPPIENDTDEIDVGSTTEMEKNSPEDIDVNHQLQQLSLGESTKAKIRENLLICDACYGFPSETRPRREKILAVAKQLYNFLRWQTGENHQGNGETGCFASVKIAVKSEKDKVALESRLHDLWKKPLPSHIQFCYDFPDDDEAVYLSPDASQALIPSEAPPSTVIVGMLIDRRIQPNRSKNRANMLGTRCARWPLEAIEKRSNIEIHKNEPLNVDVVLEGMQQWWWNEKAMEKQANRDNEWNFVHAAGQALKRHYERHPNRPLHKEADSWL